MGHLSIMCIHCTLKQKQKIYDVITMFFWLDIVHCVFYVNIFNEVCIKIILNYIIIIVASFLLPSMCRSTERKPEKSRKTLNDCGLFA